MKKEFPITPAELHELIRRRAEEIYIRSGRVSGRDLANWSQAETEIRHEMARRLPSRTAIVVKVSGVQYVGEYSRDSAGGYAPGEFHSGDRIPVRIEGAKMFVQRSNGRELETTIVQKFTTH